MNLIMGMFSAMAALIVASIWNQHREAAKTRAESTRQIERAAQESTRQIERATDKLSEEFREHRRVSEKRHDELKKVFDANHETTQHKLDKITDSLGDARERLARIEGHLHIAGPTPPGSERDAGSSRAA